MSRNWLGLIVLEDNDVMQSGVKGMKWGVRRDKDALATAAEARKTAAVESVTKAPEGAETSAARYSRLASAAKAGAGSSMTDADLKFFNSRTEALAKINKLNSTEPGWMSKTTKTVLQNSAQKTMQSISDSIANKYISGPIVKTIVDNTPAIKAETKTPIDYIGKHRAKK